MPTRKAAHAPQPHSRTRPRLWQSAAFGLLLLLLSGALPAQARPRSLSLADYPRPSHDNRRGIHWAPVLFSQPQPLVDRYLAEADGMGIRWLKLMQPDQPGLEHAYLLEEMGRRGMEPILRVQKTYNDPYTHLDRLVAAGVAAGVNYYELYSNANVAGLDGGWRSGQPIDIPGLAARWSDAARTVRAAGGYPGLPSLSPAGAVDDSTFLRRFLAALGEAGRLDALEGAWLPVQNYTGGLPLESADGFRRYERYHQIVLEMTGRALPVLSTEGGALAGEVGPAGVAEETVAAYRFMQAGAPDYFFVFTPWLLVNAAAGGYDGAWERHAWFPAQGDAQPVVAAVRALAQNGPAPATAPTPAPLAAPLHFAQQPDAARPAAESAPLHAAQNDARPLDAAPVAPAAQPAQPAPRILSRGDVTLSETAISLPTYDFESALLPTAPDDPIYPAPRLDFDRVGGPSPRSYRALLLENDFLRLTILPELGGRIYRWEDKLAGRDILYHNPVVKPTRWGVRGWWLAAGGMEWSAGLADHGLYEYLPWRAESVADSRSASVRLSQTIRDGVRVLVEISLSADARFFAVTTELHNPGLAPVSTHFWSNAMLAPAGDNRVDPRSRLVWPADQFTVHGSAGSRAFAMGATLDWPAGNGVDGALLANWPTHLSFFAAPGAQRGAVGLVDPSGELAVIRTFPPRTAPGVKTFYGPGLEPSLWSDGNDGRYFELWGGPGKDFASPVALAPAQSVRWTEQWYSVPGLGPFAAANAHAALALLPAGSGVELRLAGVSSAALAGSLRLSVRADDELLFNGSVSLSLDEIQRVALESRLAGRRWIVQLFDRQNRVLLAYDSLPVALAEENAERPPVWDSRLDELNIDITPAPAKPGQSYWKVMRAEFQNDQEGGGRHHIFIEVLDEAGKRIVGQPVEVLWSNGSAEVITEDKPAPEYAANFPMYGNLGGYSLRLPGLSETVTGMGLPGGKQHVVYNVVFQRVRK